MVDYREQAPPFLLVRRLDVGSHKGVMLMVEQFSQIGKRLPRIEGVVKATGEAKYTTDLSFPGMLIGKILRSPYAHARIGNIDTSRAQKVPGVRAIITGKDTLGISYGVRQDLPETLDELPLATDRVRYVGNEVAAIAADDEDIAEEALDLIDVEYEELPAVFDPVEAMEPGAPKIHNHAPNNISMEYFLDHGDVKKAFEESYHIREDEFTTQAVTHACLEPHGAVALVDHTGKVTLWSSTVGPWCVRFPLAKTLGLPESKVRVIKPYVGGSFGSKAELFPHEYCASLLAQKTAKPVKIIYTREEEFSFTRRRHPMRIKLKTGVKKDGTVLGVDCYYVIDNGAYNSVGPIVLQISHNMLSGGPYRIPNVRNKGLLVYTNNPIGGAMRGLGAVQMRYAMDSQMDMLAHDIGMDQVDFRRINGLEPGEITPNGFEITSCALNECIDKAEESSGWKEAIGTLSPYHGMGIACSTYISGAPWPFNASAAFIHLHADGGVTVLSGASDCGQGSDSTMCQIVAEELGVEFEDIRITSGDTELTPPDPGTYSSRVTLLAGNAVKRAAGDAKRQLLAVVGDKLEANVEDLEARHRRIYVKGSPERGMSVAEAVQLSLYLNKTPILGRGFYAAPTVLGGTNLSAAYSFGATIAEVEVDSDTGKVRFLQSTDAHDCGRAINPMSVEGQIDGSVAGGEGQALYEECVMENGLMLNPSFLEYKIPTALEVPRSNAIIVEPVDHEGPYGAKEAGEGVQVSPAPAIANAVYKATGRRIKDLPITPDKVLKALEDEGEESRE